MNKIKKLKDFFSNGHEKSIKDYQDAICDFGLVNDLTIPELYGEERKYMLSDRNELGIYQTPIQFASLLKYLEQYNFDSYLEIGVFRGGTFLFMKYFLQAKNPNIKLYCVDPTDNIHNLAKQEIQAYLIDGTSNDLINHYDLVFIDGDHSYNWAKLDWLNAGQHAKVCIFHDVNEPTCPGVVKLWNEVKQNKKHTEFIQTNHQGIGVIHND